MFIRAELEENSPPSRRQMLSAPDLGQDSLQRDLAGSIGARGGGRMIQGSGIVPGSCIIQGSGIGVRQGARLFVAHLHSGPIIFGATPGHHHAAAAVRAKTVQQVLAGREPPKILRAVPIHPGRGDPGEVQQMTRPHLAGQSIDGRGIQQVCKVYLCALQLLGNGAIRLARQHGMHVVPQTQQRRHAPAADEAAGSAHEHALALHHTASGPSSGYPASRSEITAGGKGHSMANAGSFQRSPRLNFGACATEIM